MCKLKWCVPCATFEWHQKKRNFFPFCCSSSSSRCSSNKKLSIFTQPAKLNMRIWIWCEMKKRKKLWYFAIFYWTICNAMWYNVKYGVNCKKNGLQIANAFPLISWHIKHKPNNNIGVDLCSGFRERRSERVSVKSRAGQSIYKPKLKLRRRRRRQLSCERCTASYVKCSL